MPATGSSSDIPVTIKGRSLIQSDKASFNQIKLQAGAQRSHIIPQQVYKKLSLFFDQIRDEAKFPDGTTRFDPDNWFDNGQ
jgi:hypothetical protein